MTSERSGPRWRLLAAAMVIVGVAMGALFSLGVFLAPIQAATAWSRADISAVALLAWVTLGIGSFLWGALSDRTGPRIVIVVGGLFLGLGLVLASRVDTLWQFMLAYGVLVGLAVGAFYAPLTTVVSKTFTTNRGLAIGLVSAGAGLGNFGVAGLASIGGRIFTGLVADRLGSKRTLIAMLSLQAPAILLYVVARGTASFYLLAVLFGVAYGGVMPLYALLTREYFGQRAMGGAYGAIYMLQAIGMGLGAFGGGYLYDRLGDYASMFTAAAAIAAAATLLSLALRSPRVSLPTASPASA